jgi:hypothetical protein
MGLLEVPCIKIPYTFIKKCMSVTYKFDVSGKIKSSNKTDKSYAVNIENMTLKSDALVSMKYYEYKPKAIEWANSQIGTESKIKFLDVNP